MQTIATDGIAWSVCLSVTIVSPAKTAEPIEISFGMLPWVGPGNRVLDGVQIPPCERAVLRGKGRPIVKYRDCLPFGMWTRVGPRQHALNWGARWLHLANTIEPSVCGVDVAWCEIILTTRVNTVAMSLHGFGLYWS